MKNNLFILFAFALLLVVSSCTIVVSKNVPGKKLDEIPSQFHGSYRLQTDNVDLSYLNDSEINVKIFADGLETSEEENGTDVTKLGDSLYWSTIGKTSYLSMGEGYFSVFKMVKSGDDVLMYSMFANSEVTKKQLEKYFKSVEEDVSAEETGSTTFVVEINDKKLEKYFKSGLVSKEPLKLVKK